MEEVFGYGLCQCGCGKKTTIAKQSITRYGVVGGEPNKYLVGHHRRGKYNGKLDAFHGKRESNMSWKGGRRKNNFGYSLIYMPEHPRAGKNGYVLEHIVVAESVLGKYLPQKAVVHHINQDRSDNRKENLVICESDAFHRVLHQRMAALKACGIPSFRKCNICKKYDDPQNLTFNSKNRSVRHDECQRLYTAKRRSKNG